MGKACCKKRNYELISIFHKALSGKSGHQYVDQTTWFDLNMNELFTRLDRNISAIGSQYLYHKLHKYEDNISLLHSRFNQYKFFINNQHIREEIQQILHRLHNNLASYLPNLFLKNLPGRPRFFILFYFSSLLSVLSIVSLFYYPPLLIVAMAFAIINIFINHFYGRMVSGYYVDISYLSILLNTVGSLSNVKSDEEIEQITVLKKHRHFARSLNKKIGWLIIDSSKMNELAAAFVDYLNYFCLFKVVSFVHSIKYIKNNQAVLGEIYEATASMDASISVASYLCSLPEYCRPQFSEDKSMLAENIYHPLVDNAISNSLSLKRQSALITGSNMAGKTTFIKTIGINIILARTLYFCHAQRAKFPTAIVRSSIRREDNLMDNKSYYYREIEAILEFIRLADDDNGDYYFLIDEIFKGTNTVERVASASSVLKDLAAKSTVLVTTHDVELQDLLNELFKMYHFSEQVENDRHYFDYKLKSGPTKSRNAIKLLELKGYPSSIVDEANRLASRFDSERS